MYQIMIFIKLQEQVDNDGDGVDSVALDAGLSWQ